MQENQSKTTLTELLHINAPLAVAELTWRGETVRHIPWAKDEFIVFQYCVFEYKDSCIYYWYDQSGIDWKIAQAGQFDEAELIANIHNKYEKIKDIIISEKALSRHELPSFIDSISELWIWLDGVWWMIEHRDKHHLDAKKLLETRKYTEYFAPGLIATIRNTFKSLMPDYEMYADVITIEEALGKREVNTERLNQRVSGAVYANGKLFKSMDEVQKVYNLRLLHSAPPDNGVLKGQTAYPGNVKGIARIIKSRDDMSKFKQGDVIVSPTTTPDFLPVMRISAAIVSEHGGIICHAAITSRELKIPCVVGVRGATKILKDGDMVEVDANKGFVKILK